MQYKFLLQYRYIFLKYFCQQIDWWYSQSHIDLPMTFNNTTRIIWCHFLGKRHFFTKIFLAYFLLFINPKGIPLPKLAILQCMGGGHNEWFFSHWKNIPGVIFRVKNTFSPKICLDYFFYSGLITRAYSCYFLHFFGWRYANPCSGSLRR